MIREIFQILQLKDRIPIRLELETISDFSDLHRDRVKRRNPVNGKR